ncbi:hypothetical protein ACOL23_09920 [Aliarcobacter butzleri]
MVLFFILVVGYSAYSNLNQLKEDCGNPFSRDCIANIFWYSFQITPFGYVINPKNYE